MSVSLCQMRINERQPPRPSGLVVGRVVAVTQVSPPSGGKMTRHTVLPAMWCPHYDVRLVACGEVCATKVHLFLLLLFSACPAV